MFRFWGIIWYVCGSGHCQRFCNHVKGLGARHRPFNFFEHDPPVLEVCINEHEHLFHCAVCVTGFPCDFDATVERHRTCEFIVHVAHLDAQVHHSLYSDSDFRLGKAPGQPKIGLLIDDFIIEGGEIFGIDRLTSAGVYQQQSRRPWGVRLTSIMRSRSRSELVGGVKRGVLCIVIDPWTSFLFFPLSPIRVLAHGNGSSFAGNEAGHTDELDAYRSSLNWSCHACVGSAAFVSS